MVEFYRGGNPGGDLTPKQLGKRIKKSVGVLFPLGGRECKNSEGKYSEKVQGMIHLLV